MPGLVKGSLTAGLLPSGEETGGGALWRGTTAVLLLAEGEVCVLSGQLCKVP